ncbi:hypothetical protein KP509_02G010500 [Ceratopteris richardii]|uniref:Splicing factor U2af large subunit n=1 Tax=Ceratopteris richardii TaxID=49495 RepID=A0A8T2VAI9_CERRI|nr:hypothetical protein KP509_02G010500 [Ceratopteris richardii]
MTDHEENGGFYDDAGGQTVPFHKDHSNGSRYYDRESLESRGRSHKDYDYGSENQRKDERVRTERSDRDSHGRSHRSRHHARGHDRNRHGYEHERDRIRDRNRERDQERDREQRHTHRSHSRSKESSRRHSRSRSRSHERRSLKRQSGFDMAPPAAALPNSLLPGLPPTVPAVLPGMFPFPAATQFGGLAAMSMQSMTQQATRHARRVYVGGLPPLANEQTIATFFSQVMAAIGGNTAGAGDAVVNVYINHEKKFAFVEMRTVEEASNAMALDGIIFEGVSVRVRRPTDYNPSVAATLGPSQPSPHLNLAAVGLTPGAIGGADGPDRVFVGGLPYYLTEAQIRELLESFGSLRGFDLVKDQDTGNSKGYGFCVYQDPAVTDVACAALNGLKMGDKTLTVRRATASGQPKPDQFGAFTQASLALGAAGGLTGFGSLTPTLPTGVVPGMVPSLAGGVTSMFETPTKVICLSQVNHCG